MNRFFSASRPPRVRTGLSVWEYVGIALGITLGVGGLVLVGVIVLVIVGLNGYASNK